MADTEISLQVWRARCKCCQWESKDCHNTRAAYTEFIKHSHSHLVYEPVERKIEDHND